jgi:uncharacterized protein (TIGR02145 family)
MASNNITFYKLVSPYPEDTTKNCGLTGQELDTNFFNLKTMDIKSGTWDPVSETITLSRIDDSKVVISLSGITEHNYNFTYDPIKGEMHIETPGGSFDVTGFTTMEMLNTIYSDNSIDGFGSIESPLTISPLFRPGTYRPALKVIDTTTGGTLPAVTQLAKGDRYVTAENVSDFGLLYNFNGVKSIMNDLALQKSEWRVPTKADWDGMLNAIEFCDIDRTHTNNSSNAALGKYAGALLKAKKTWLQDASTGTTTGGTIVISPCSGTTAETVNVGVDYYGFSALAAGYGDGGIVKEYYKQRADFWTSTQLNLTDVYSKRLDYNRSTVFQEAVGTAMQLSIRLVKDFTGDNFNERETINGMDYNCVLMPDENGKTKIWTQTNIAFVNPSYQGVQPNIGTDPTISKRFFINEWIDGRWIKNEIKEAETIVLVTGLNGDTFGEYMVVNGVLTPVTGLIYDQIMSQLGTRLDALDAKITAETIRSTAAEETLGTKITDETTARTAADTALGTRITDETTARTAADAALGTRITEVDTKITAETAARIANDIDKTKTYTIDPVNGLTLLTGDGNQIKIGVNGNFGTY